MFTWRDLVLAELIRIVEEARLRDVAVARRARAAAAARRWLTDVSGKWYLERCAAVLTHWRCVCVTATRALARAAAAQAETRLRTLAAEHRRVVLQLLVVRLRTHHWEGCYTCMQRWKLFGRGRMQEGRVIHRCLLHIAWFARADALQSWKTTVQQQCDKQQHLHRCSRSYTSRLLRFGYRRWDHRVGIERERELVSTADAARDENKGLRAMQSVHEQDIKLLHGRALARDEECLRLVRLLGEQQKVSAEHERGEKQWQQKYDALHRQAKASDAEWGRRVWRLEEGMVVEQAIWQDKYDLLHAQTREGDEERTVLVQELAEERRLRVEGEAEAVDMQRRYEEQRERAGGAEAENGHLQEELAAEQAVGERRGADLRELRAKYDALREQVSAGLLGLSVSIDLDPYIH
jgi:hypothetical protein